MYAFSRALSRELSPHLVPGPRRPGAPALALLARCEQALERLARDGRSAAQPSERPLSEVRSLALFREVRSLFPVSRRLLADEVIRARLEEARRALAAAAPDDEALASMLRCRATNRRGRACRRDPPPGRRFCPSHRGLAGEGAAMAA